MSKKRKQKENDSTVSVDLPQTFREITQLPNADLNNLLRQLNLPTKGKRAHKYTVLASHLGIQTTNTDKSDPFLQTLNDINAIVDGWLKDLRQVPDVKLDTILKYLLAAHDISDKSTCDFETYDQGSLRSYKALRAYDLWESGHISGFTFNPLSDIENFCALRCCANPSGDTSGTQYQVTVVLKENGEPIGASCSCVAGLGEACTHIAGLLFGVEDFVSRGYKQLPDSLASTEKLCKWIVPRGPKVEPKAIKDVSVKKNVPGLNKKEKKFSASSYNPLPAEKETVCYDDLTLLHHTLSLQCPALPWVKAVAPAIVKKYSEGTSNKYLKSADIKTLPERVSSLDPVLVPASDTCINTNYEPMTLKEKMRVKLSSGSTEPVSYTQHEKKKIEQLTKNQSNSVHWHKYRLGIITASNYNRVASHVRTISKRGESKTTSTLTSTLLNGSAFKGNKATRYGQSQEPNAAAAYLLEMNKNHHGCRVEKCGLFISDEHHYLGASPDRIFTCKCHGSKLVEIKCPYTLTDASRTIQSMDFVEMKNGELSLKKSGNSYYDQIQGQMGVTGIHCCDLVVWDGQNIEIVAVKFDQLYWNSLAKSLNYFHNVFVYQELIKSESGGLFQDRANVQTAVSKQTNRYPCGICGKLLAETVTCDEEASINCECECKCGLWFHWKCVNFQPDSDLLDEEPAWFCPNCVRNCDIVM